ncbi:MAG: CBS domain-containing protein [Desulfobacterales bacterium]
MKNITVKEIMVPLSGYATVDENATLMDAVLSLEKAQQEVGKNPYVHRAVLVLNSKGNVVGKISQMDVLRALEPKYMEMQGSQSIAHLGFTKSFMKQMFHAYNLWASPLDDICRKGCERKVRDFMYKPGEGEYVEEDTSMDEAIHQLVMGHHQSLLVTKGETAVGILRLTDVFSAVVEKMKTCAISACAS